MVGERDICVSRFDTQNCTGGAVGERDTHAASAHSFWGAKKCRGGCDDREVFFSWLIFGVDNVKQQIARQSWVHYRFLITSSSRKYFYVQAQKFFRSFFLRYFTARIFLGFIFILRHNHFPREEMAICIEHRQSHFVQKESGCFVSSVQSILAADAIRQTTSRLIDVVSAAVPDALLCCWTGTAKQDAKMCFLKDWNFFSWTFSVAMNVFATG